MGAFTPIWSYFGADEPNYLYGPHGRELLHELGDLGRTADVPVYFAHTTCSRPATAMRVLRKCAIER